MYYSNSYGNFLSTKSFCLRHYCCPHLPHFSEIDPAIVITSWYRSASDFLASLQNIQLNEGICNQPILRGILSALQHSPYTHAQSPYFIFADALASDFGL